MATSKARFAVIAAAILVLSLGRHAAADRDFVRQANVPEEWDLRKKSNKNKKSGRLYAGFHWDAEKQQLLRLHAWSFDHQPEILVFNTGSDGKTTGLHLKKSEPHEKYKDDKGRWVYGCSVDFVAPAGAKYRVIYTHIGDGTPGKFKADGEIYSKEKESSGSLSPTITGFKGKSWGKPDGPLKPGSSTRLVGTEYDGNNGKRGMELEGRWVPRGVSSKPTWGPGAVDPKYLAQPESKAGDMIHRVYKSGGKDVVIVSKTKKAYVLVKIYADFRANENAFVNAGRRMLEEMENRAADR